MEKELSKRNKDIWGFDECYGVPPLCHDECLNCKNSLYTGQTKLANPKIQHIYRAVNDCSVRTLKRLIKNII